MPMPPLHTHHLRHILDACLATFIRQDDGQNVAEYGLLVAGVGLLVLVSAASLGVHVHDWFQAIAAHVTSLIGA
jgi:Flp pilus assembly pilin Flp